jgi:hypothetical protein
MNHGETNGSNAITKLCEITLKKRYQPKGSYDPTWKPVGDIYLDNFDIASEEKGIGEKFLDGKLYKGRQDPLVLPCLLVAEGTRKLRTSNTEKYRIDRQLHSHVP